MLFLLLLAILILSMVDTREVLAFNRSYILEGPEP